MTDGAQVLSDIFWQEYPENDEPINGPCMTHGRMDRIDCCPELVDGVADGAQEPTSYEPERVMPREGGPGPTSRLPSGSPESDGAQPKADGTQEPDK